MDKNHDILSAETVKIPDSEKKRKNRVKKMQGVNLMLVILVKLIKQDVRSEFHVITEAPVFK